MPVRSWVILSGLLLGSSIVAQTPAPVDTAPPPSSRFPASWYPPPSDATYTVAPVTGEPYTGVLVTSLQRADRTTGGKQTLTRRTLQARDAEGRRRDEQEMPRPDGKGGTVIAHEVSVSDPVSHCSFRWLEPWVATGSPVATVTCMPRTVHYSNQKMFAEGVATTRQESQTRFEHTVRDPLGHRLMDGLDAIGTRTTLERLDAQGNVRQTVTTELWYSPELDELLAFGPSTPDTASASAQQLPSFTLTEIHRGAPDPKLFYPPAGYDIKSSLPDPR